MLSKLALSNLKVSYRHGSDTDSCLKLGKAKVSFRKSTWKLKLLTNIWLKSTWMNVSNNDDIGGLEFRLLCVKSPPFTASANCDDYFSFQKILILKKKFESFLFWLFAESRGPRADWGLESTWELKLNSFPASLLAYCKLSNWISRRPFSWVLRKLKQAEQWTK